MHGWGKSEHGTCPMTDPISLSSWPWSVSQSCWHARKEDVIYLANQHLKGDLERCGRYPHEDDRPCWSDIVACLDIRRSLRNRIDGAELAQTVHP